MITDTLAALIVIAVYSSTLLLFALKEKSRKP